MVRKRRRDRLQRCWYDMKIRVNVRSNCSLYPPWEDFLVFKIWALDNGYTDKLCICRNGDTGNYEPDNIRFDTKANNTIEAHAKKHRITKPCGLIIDITNLAEYCRITKGITQSGMAKVLCGQRKHHKGYKVVALSD